MDISQDIWSCKMRYLPVCVYLICLLKSIKKIKNKNKYGIENIMQGQTYKKYYLRINIFLYKIKFTCIK
jgi:hypothetical protein